MESRDQTPIGDDVRRFILSCVATVPHLEALLLMSGDDQSAKSWDCARVASRLYLSERTTAAVLADLAAIGLLESMGENPPEYYYAPRTAAIAAVVSQLGDTYKKHLIEVTRLIHSRDERKAQRFADAFWWRKE